MGNKKRGSKKNVENPQYFGDVAPSAWPGERLGLQKEGSLSIGRIGRRVGAIFIDWALASLIAGGMTKFSITSFGESFAPTLTLIVFMVMQIIFIPTIGGSIGHRLFGMRIIRLGGGWVGFWRPIVRTVLLALVLPVIVWDSDQRGFHDKIAGTALVLS